MTTDDAQSAAFIEEQRAWTNGYKQETGLVWSELSKRTNINEKTLSLFASGKYEGRNLPLAQKVKQYRDYLAARDTTFIDAPEIPGYFETQTSEELLTLLHWCQRGKMVQAALGSGLGKSMTAKHFATLYPNVFIATVWPSQGSQGPMQINVLKALGISNATGTPHVLSQMICDKLAAMHRPVLILDEAQELTIKALEEIRGWFDYLAHIDAHCGIALLGDQRLHKLISNSDLPQLRRRLKKMNVRVKPYQQDVAALCSAWNIHEKRLVTEMERVAEKPGGLGIATQVLEMAGIIAASEKKIIDLSHLQEAAADVMHQPVVA